MVFPSKWLIATNGTKYASAAVEYAGRLAAQLNKKPKVTILVVASTEDSEEVALGIVEMAKYLFEEEAQGQVIPHLEVKIGEPGFTIAQTAMEFNCDHVLIGGADFKWDINDDTPGGVSNYIIANFDGVISVIK